MVAVGPFFGTSDREHAGEVLGKAGFFRGQRVALTVYCNGSGGAILNISVQGVHHGGKFVIGSQLTVIEESIHVIRAEEVSQHQGIDNIAVTFYVVGDAVAVGAVGSQLQVIGEGVVKCFEVRVGGQGAQVGSEAAFLPLGKLLDIHDGEERGFVFGVHLRTEGVGAVGAGAQGEELDF